MLTPANPAGLEGLLDLDRQGVDIRPTLLRVITDQYLQTAVHTQDEERQFTELALRLIDETDVATRAAVATRLAPHSSAPRPIILQLARDVLDVAEPILLHSPCLMQADLDAIATERGRCYAEIIARRQSPEERSEVSAAATAGETAMIPERQRANEIDAAVPDSTLTRSSDAEACELCELFFAAGAEERRLILLALDCVPAIPARPPSQIPLNDIWRLESAALQHHTATVIQDLERALGISAGLARRIVQDELGEPIVVAAKALGLPPDVLQRVLLFMNPRVGQSVERVHKLSQLHAEITLEAARLLIDIWQDAEPVAAPSASRKAHWQETVQRARQALSEISVRRTARTGQPAAISRYRSTGTDL
jgi:hypothetical protein